LPQKIWLWRSIVGWGECYRAGLCLRDQLLRAAVSVPSNIAEGYARETSADRKHFLTIALGSCAELETQLLIASEVGLIASASAQALIAKVNEVSKMLFSLRRKL
jgi:four helix bundle protein